MFVSILKLTESNSIFVCVSSCLLQLYSDLKTESTLLDNFLDEVITFISVLTITVIAFRVIRKYVLRVDVVATCFMHAYLVLAYSF